MMAMEALDLQAYDDWLADHMEDLVRQYAGKTVAIHHGQIVAVDESETEVYRQVAAIACVPRPLVFRVPRERDVESILLSSGPPQAQALCGRAPGRSLVPRDS
jgi:hypothetical protein